MMAAVLLQQVLYYVALFGVAYHVVTMPLAAVVAVSQEAKIWKLASTPASSKTGGSGGGSNHAHRIRPPLSVLGRIKLFVSVLIWMTVCLLGSLLICVKYALTLGQSDLQEDAYLVEQCASKAIIGATVGRVDVIGIENLPPPRHGNISSNASPIVYVANHASQIDGSAVYWLERRFRWTMKRSILFLPGIGFLVALAGHILIQRPKKRDKERRNKTTNGNGKEGSSNADNDGSDDKRSNKSVSNFFEKANESLQSGMPIFVFPQGTRSMSERLPFKDGAFIVAETTRATIVPVSIDIPVDAWNSYYPVNLLLSWRRTPTTIPTVKLTVHEPIPYDPSWDRVTVKSKCSDVIYSVLPTSMYGGGDEDLRKNQ